MKDNRVIILYSIGSFLFYTFVFILYTYPLITVFATSVSGGSDGDSAQYLWNSFVFKEQLAHNANPFYTDYTFYPYGANLFFHTYTPLISLFALPFDNLYLATNLMLFLQFAFSGLGAFLLSYKLLKHPVLALLIGFIFAFSPYKMAHFTEHFHLMLTATIPFYILAIIRGTTFDEHTHRPRVKSYAQLGCAFFLLLLTFFSDYYATFYLLFFTVIYCTFPALQVLFKKITLLKQALILGIVILLSHIIINQLIRHGVNDNAAFWWQPDLTFFAVPSFISKFFDTTSYYLRFSSSGLSLEVPIFLGWSFLILLFYVLYTFYKPSSLRTSIPSPFALYVFLAIFFIGMTVPEIQFLDKGIFYLPTGFYYIAPFFNNIRIPGRASLMVYLFLPLVFAYLWIHSKPLLSAWVYKAMPFVCLLLLFFEFMPHAYPMQNREKQKALNTWIKEQPGTVMLSFPFGVLDGFSRLGMPKTEGLIDQITHRKKILGGYVSRVKPEVFDSYKNDSICKILFALQAKNDSIRIQIVDKKYTEKFLLQFKPNLIYLPQTYKNSSLQRFLESNFAPYITAKDSMDEDVIYRLK